MISGMVGASSLAVSKGKKSGSDHLDQMMAGKTWLFGCLLLVQVDDFQLQLKSGTLKPKNYPPVEYYWEHRRFVFSGFMEEITYLSK